MSNTKEEWDHKHGLHGWKRGTDYDDPNGATHGSASLSLKQVQGRIFELFGKAEHTEERRLMGIPTHFDQLQGLLKNLKAGTGADKIAVSEAQIEKDIVKALQFCSINIPPLGLVLPNTNRVMLFYKHGQDTVSYSQVFEAGKLADTLKFYKLSGTEIGDFHKQYTVYKAWSYYKSIAPVSVTQADAHYTVMGNFFGKGLQWDAFNDRGE